MSRLCVSELMHPCTAATILADSTLRDAAEQVLITGLESLPVVDECGRFAGLIAQAALIRELLRCGSGDARVAPIVSRHVESARATASLDSVLPLFRSAGITMIPVVDECDCPVGLIHRQDVIRYLLEEPRAASPSDNRPTGPHFLRERRTNSEK